MHDIFYSQSRFNHVLPTGDCGLEVNVAFLSNNNAVLFLKMLHYNGNELCVKVCSWNLETLVTACVFRFSKISSSFDLVWRDIFAIFSL